MCLANSLDTSCLPFIIMKGREPLLGTSLAGRDMQAQAPMQIFLNIVEWGMSAPDDALAGADGEDRRSALEERSANYACPKGFSHRPHLVSLLQAKQQE